MAPKESRRWRQATDRHWHRRLLISAWQREDTPVRDAVETFIEAWFGPLQRRLVPMRILQRCGLAVVLRGQDLNLWFLGLEPDDPLCPAPPLFAEFRYPLLLPE